MFIGFMVARRCGEGGGCSEEASLGCDTNGTVFYRFFNEDKKGRFLGFLRGRARLEGQAYPFTGLMRPDAHAQFQ
jgi:hypothetical protein